MQSITKAGPVSKHRVFAESRSLIFVGVWIGERIHTYTNQDVQLASAKIPKLEPLAAINLNEDVICVLSRKRHITRDLKYLIVALLQTNYGPSPRSTAG